MKQWPFLGNNGSGPGGMGTGVAGVGLPQVTQYNQGKPAGAMPIFGYAFNPNTGIFDLLQIDGNDRDGDPPVITGLLKSDCYMYGFDDQHNVWNRMRVSSGGTLTIPGSTTWANSNITVTNASQQFLAANNNRSTLTIQNNDPVGIIYINFGAVATVANGYAIYPGGDKTFSHPAPNNAVFIIGSIANNPNVIILAG